jgi:hypothetical protein
VGEHERAADPAGGVRRCGQYGFVVGQVVQGSCHLPEQVVGRAGRYDEDGVGGPRADRDE